eukprot:UN09007
MDRVRGLFKIVLGLANMRQMQGPNGELLPPIAIPLLTTTKELCDMWELYAKYEKSLVKFNTSTILPDLKMPHKLYKRLQIQHQCPHIFHSHPISIQLQKLMHFLKSLFATSNNNNNNNNSSTSTTTTTTTTGTATSGNTNAPSSAGVLQILQNKLNVLCFVLTEIIPSLKSVLLVYKQWVMTDPFNVMPYQSFALLLGNYATRPFAVSDR